MPSFIRFAAIALLALVSALPAQAQQIGVGVAQAPEAGMGVCFGEGADATLACARQACMEESGLGPSDCLRTNWCYPAGWTADIFMQHQEGLHWHEVACGWNDRAQLEKAVAVKCESEWLIECSIVRMWDNQGEEITFD
ncbi:hypothetical protein [Cucumibacter marinus]|uniref:hypothetical protein n=1 Tax=Cucumibacter marinus TaxID=1121252 RepID=UPI00040F1478|nr:hypothetical protein [Cucumibacter marinus]